MRLTLSCLVVLTCTAIASAQTGVQPNELAHAYQAWQQASDIEGKIVQGERALTLATAEPWPLSISRQRFQAELWSGLGAAYASRSHGVFADNLEKAIGYLQSALTIWTRKADAQNWAMTHNNLGAAYWQRIRGERADNQETAIAHFEAARSVFTLEAAPEMWGQLQNNLGIVYWDRIQGDRGQNLEAAIASFEASLSVITKENDPDRWAAAQNNLANAFAKRTLGEQSDNREMAIAHLEAALSVFSRDSQPEQWARAQNNLAIAYQGRILGNASDNQEKAIACFTAALTVFSRDTTPHLWAEVQHNLGSAYAARIMGDRGSNRQQAAVNLRQALTVFTRDASPLDHLRTARLLALVLLSSGEWTDAAPLQASAREAFLLLSGQGASETETRALIAEAGPLFAESAYAALQRGETDKAFELADEGRARLLTVALELQTIELPADRRRRIDELRVSLRAAQAAADAAHGPERAEAIDRVISQRRELFAILDSGSKRKSTGVSALAEARRIAAGGGTVVMPVVTDFGGKLLVVTPKKTSPTVLDVPALTTQSLSKLLVGSKDRPNSGWIGAYFVNYLTGSEAEERWPDWISGIDEVGPELWRLFAGTLDAALRESGLKNGARLVWLPSGWLGILPLGLARDPGGNRRFADHYEIAYSPSLDALSIAEGFADKPEAATLAAVVNPTGDLPGTEKEVALIAPHFAAANRTILEGASATPDRVLASLKGKTYWHFATHGAFSWTDARQSALLLHNAPLTLSRLQDTEGLGRPRLVVLSACETGLYDIRNSPDEFIGLPAAFTALGARGVVGSLWPVSDAATALLMARFYELHLDAGLDAPAALSQAQAWLREASTDDLNGYSSVAAAKGNLQGTQLPAIAQELRSASRGLPRRSIPGEFTTGSSTPANSESSPPSTAHPYAHPYYWAGFVYTGR